MLIHRKDDRTGREWEYIQIPQLVQLPSCKSVIKDGLLCRYINGVGDPSPSLPCKSHVLVKNLQ
jgi:hypothetical protein